MAPWHWRYFCNAPEIRCNRLAFRRWRFLRMIASFSITSAVRGSQVCSAHWHPPMLHYPRKISWAGQGRSKQ
ncbi:hypothetical protein EDD16DRAFT_1561051 [Pisolithus croceorrhizus]|nr:hypothetical protein EDD16DRAFT_1561051 [Pisolithus croceorrhizus]